MLVTALNISVLVLLVWSTCCWTTAFATVKDSKSEFEVRVRKGAQEPTKKPKPAEFGLIVVVTKELIAGTPINPNRLKKIRVYPRIKSTKYPNGKTCDKGQDPWNKAEMKIILERANKLPAVRQNANGANLTTLQLSAGQQKTMNEAASKKLGKNCDNIEEKCAYHADKNSFICRSSILEAQSILTLLVSAFVLHHVLKNRPL